ncbi:MAG: hypothetical protein M3297_14335, partial [Thermoproteota archaeon]|nr:hypothetical protein [Thermoproteota archaeon]
MKPQVRYSCRLKNHDLSARRIEIKDKFKLISNQITFLVTCYDCGFKWKEVWTRSSWFIRN